MKRNRKSLYNVIVGLVTLTSFILFSCSNESKTHLLSTPGATIFTPTPIATLTAEGLFYPEIDLAIELKNAHQEVVEIQKGQIFQIKKPGLASEWQVDFDPDLFERLTPLEMMRSPGKDGWVFRAVSQGQGRLSFTSIVICNEPVPCPMMPAQLELNLEAR